MDMFQLNTFPAGGITMKTQDFGLMSGRITIAQAAGMQLRVQSRVSLTAKNRARDLTKVHI